MAINMKSGRQGVRWAYVDITKAMLTSGAAAEAIDLPPNAIVVDGFISVTTAFDSGTSDVIVVGDSATANRYRASTTIAATGLTALTRTGFVVTQATRKVRVTWTGAGTAATTGALTLAVAYIVRGVSDIGAQGLDT